MKMTHGLYNVGRQTLIYADDHWYQMKSEHKYWIATKKKLLNIFMPFNSFMNVFWIPSNWFNHKDYMGKLNID